jgi:hypothetical protein
MKIEGRASAVCCAPLPTEDTSSLRLLRASFKNFLKRAHFFSLQAGSVNRYESKVAPFSAAHSIGQLAEKASIFSELVRAFRKIFSTEPFFAKADITVRPPV